MSDNSRRTYRNTPEPRYVERAQHCDEACGVIIQANSDTTVSGWSVPSLTVEQVTQAYNTLVAGQSCVIANSNGKVHYTAVLGDVLSGQPYIMITHYNTGFIDYTVNDSGTSVEITVHQSSSDNKTKFYKHSVLWYGGTGEDIRLTIVSLDPQPYNEPYIFLDRGENVWYMQNVRAFTLAGYNNDVTVRGEETITTTTGGQLNGVSPGDTFVSDTVTEL